MNRHNKKAFDHAKLITSYSGTLKIIKFYESPSFHLVNAASVTEYDGETFHMLVNPEFFNAVLRNNHQALVELEEKLRKRNSLFLLYPRILWYALFVGILSIFFFIGTKILISEQVLAEQERIINIMNILGSVFIVGGLLRRILSAKYSSSRYDNILLLLDEKSYNAKFKAYFSKQSYIPNPAFRPFTHVLGKNILFTVFVLLLCGAALLVVSPGILSPTSSVPNQSELVFEYFKRNLVPTKATSSYTLDSTTEIDFDNDEVNIWGNYIVSYDNPSWDNFTVYRNDGSLMFDLDYAYPNIHYIQVLEFEDEYMLLEIEDGERHYVIYNLETNVEEHILYESDFSYLDFTGFSIHNFTHDGDTFYLTFSSYSAFVESKYEHSAVVILDDVSIQYVPIDEYVLYDVLYHDGTLYYITGDNNNYENLSVATSRPTNFNLRVGNQKIEYAQQLVAYNDEIYIRSNHPYENLIHVNDDLSFTSIFVGNASYNRYDSTQTLFLFGNSYNDFEEIDETGTIVNMSIVCDECTTAGAVFKKDGDTLYAIEDGRIRTFMESSTSYTTYPAFPDIEYVYDDLHTDHQTIYTWGIGIMITIASLPFLRIMIIFIRRSQIRQRFESNLF